MDFFVDLESYLAKRRTPIRYIILVSVFLFFLICALLASVINGNYLDFIATCVAGVIAWSFSKEIDKVRDNEHLINFQKGLATNGLDSSSFAFFIFSHNGRCVFLNRVAQNLFPGFKIRSVEDLLVCFGKYPKIIDAIRDMQLAAQGEKQAHVDVPISLENGNTVLWRIAVAPIPNYSGFVGWMIIDLTPSSSKVESFETDACALLNLINNSTVGYCCVDEIGKITFCNNTFLHWLNDKNVVGRDYEEVITIRQNNDDELTEKLLTNIPMKVQLNFGTHENLIATRILESNGSAAYIFTQEMQQATELLSALNTTKMYFEHIFEDAPVGIMITKGAEMITMGNRATMDLIGMNIEDTSVIDYIDDEQKETVRKKLYGALSEIGPVAPFEITLKTSKPKDVMAYISKIDDNKRNKDNDGLVLYLIDVTARKALQQQFVQSQKMQAVGQLAGGIAHDFNNLLTAMIGYCDLLLEKFLPSDRSFNDIMQIKQNANRASNLVRQLLAFSRQQTMQPKILEVSGMINELSALLKRLLGVKIELKVKHGNVGSIRVDQIQFEQVIINLAVNARDAMTNGGTLSITTSEYSSTAPKILRGETMPAGNYILIEVADTGCGIEEKHIERIFDPFFSTKEKGHGTGLGLSTVYGIVHQTGGFIYVESKIGVGTKFSLYFQKVSSEEVEQNQQNQHQERKLVDLTGAGTILLVEDEDAVRSFSARALRDKGYNIIEAPNGEVALECIKKQGDEIDLIVSDVVMPKMDGPTLINEIQKYEHKPKVIFISGYTEDSFRESLATNSDVHFLSKPFNLKQLAMKVKEVMGR